MSITLLQKLEEEVDERQNELNNTLLTLEREAAQESGYSKKIRVAIIFLGALSATNAVAVKVTDDTYSSIVIVLYSVFGLLIATLGGIEAAFGFQKKAADFGSFSHQVQITYFGY